MVGSLCGESLEKAKRLGSSLGSQNGSPLAQLCNFPGVNQPCRQPPLLSKSPDPQVISQITMSTETASTSDNVEIYKQLEEYTWNTDKEFQVRGLRTSHSASAPFPQNINSSLHWVNVTDNPTSSDWTRCHPRTQPVTISTSRPHPQSPVLLPLTQEVYPYRL